MRTCILQQAVYTPDFQKHGILYLKPNFKVTPWRQSLFPQSVVKWTNPTRYWSLPGENDLLKMSYGSNDLFVKLLSLYYTSIVKNDPFFTYWPHPFHSQCLETRNNYHASGWTYVIPTYTKVNPHTFSSGVKIGGHYSRLQNRLRPPWLSQMFLLRRKIFKNYKIELNAYFRLSLLKLQSKFETVLTDLSRTIS